MHRPWPPAAARGLLLLALLSACGGGGGGGARRTWLGLVSGTVPTPVFEEVANPLGAAATVLEVPTPGPFALAPGQLPQVLAPGASLTLELRFTPPGPGPAEGEVAVRFEAGETSQEWRRAYGAEAERVVWEADPPTPWFGPLEPGAAAQRPVRLRNASLLSPVVLVSAAAPPGFAWQGPPFPLALGPGEEALGTLAFEAGAPGLVSGVLDLDANAPGAAARLPVLGFTAGATGRWDLDLGVVDVGTAPSRAVRVDLPPEAGSLAIEALTDPAVTLDVAEWLAPGGATFRGLSGTGPLATYLTPEVLSVHAPGSDAPEAQLPPTGGVHALRFVRTGPGAPTPAALRAFAWLRVPGPPPEALLDLRLWFLPETEATAAEGPTYGVLQDALARLDEVLGQQGIRLGEVQYLDGPPGADGFVGSVPALQALCRLTAGAPGRGLNVFLARRVLTGNTIGVSASIDGPARDGTRASGLTVRFDGLLSANVLGLILAHEIGHYLGLYHTRESAGGLVDPILDTAPCTGLPAGTCDPDQPPNLMHYAVFEASHLTAGQGLVLRGHPLLRPAEPAESAKPGTPAPGGAFRRRAPRPYDARDRALWEALGPCACGACAFDPSAAASPGDLRRAPPR